MIICLLREWSNFSFFFFALDFRRITFWHLVHFFPFLPIQSSLRSPSPLEDFFSDASSSTVSSATVRISKDDSNAPQSKGNASAGVQWIFLASLTLISFPLCLLLNLSTAVCLYCTVWQHWSFVRYFIRYRSFGILFLLELFPFSFSDVIYLCMSIPTFPTISVAVSISVFVSASFLL